MRRFAHCRARLLGSETAAQRHKRRWTGIRHCANHTFVAAPPLRHVAARLAGHGHLARLDRVLVLLMASTLRHRRHPSFDQPDELAELHATHRAEGLGWAMSR